MQSSGALRKLALSAFVVGGTPALCACISVSENGYYDDHPYPPAYPPGGYWYDYPGHPGLYFDSGLGLYSIHGYPHHYFHGGYFYRWHSGHWSRSRHWGRHWEDCDARHLPRPVHLVHDRHHARGHLRHHDRGRADGHDDRRGHRGRSDRTPARHESRQRDWNQDEAAERPEAPRIDPGNARRQRPAAASDRGWRARADRIGDRPRQDRQNPVRREMRRGATRSQPVRPQRSR